MKKVTAVVVLALLVATGCDLARVGARCRTGAAPARDATHVLTCTKGRWARSITIARAAEVVAGLRPASIEIAEDTITADAGETVRGRPTHGEPGVILSVRRRDGGDAAGVRVRIAAPTAPGSAGLAEGSVLEATSDAVGHLVFDGLRTNGVVGGFDMVATVVGTDVTRTLHVDNAAGAPALVSLLTGTDQTIEVGETSAPVTVRVLDRFGNRVRTGFVVGLVSPTVGLTTGGDPWPTDPSVDPTFTFSLPAAGTYVIQVSASNPYGSASTTFGVTVTPF